MLLLSTYKDILTNPGTSMDPYIIRTEGTLNELYNVILYIGGFGLVVGLLMVACSLMVGNSGKRRDGKERLSDLLIWGAVLFATGALCTVFYGIVGSILL